MKCVPITSSETESLNKREQSDVKLHDRISIDILPAYKPL